MSVKYPSASGNGVSVLATILNRFDQLIYGGILNSPGNHARMEDLAITEIDGNMSDQISASIEENKISAIDIPVICSICP